jgi:hypothetical protein
MEQKRRSSQDGLLFCYATTWFVLFIRKARTVILLNVRPALRFIPDKKSGDATAIRFIKKG